MFWRGIKRSSGPHYSPLYTGANNECFYSGPMAQITSTGNPPRCRPIFLDIFGNQKHKVPGNWGKWGASYPHIKWSCKKVYPLRYPLLILWKEQTGCPFLLENENFKTRIVVGRNRINPFAKFQSHALCDMAPTCLCEHKGAQIRSGSFSATRGMQESTPQSAFFSPQRHVSRCPHGNDRLHECTLKIEHFASTK